jgi:hypothetical protein
MRKIVFLLMSWLTIPHILFYLLSKNKKVLDKDIDRWAQCLNVKESVILGG